MFKCLLNKYVATLLFAFFLSKYSDGQVKEFKDIAFHLYTDSLKKGVQNYINVDGLQADGHWFPLDTTLISYSSSGGRWEQNNLIIPTDYKKDSVVIKVFLLNQPIMTQTTTIYIKKNPDPTVLPTQQDILDSYKKRKRRN
ncbi:hypothetical protein [Rhizosphaericola mali]|uniref:Uncharacterized protein n=1 Tax=Rhizosphaericola mali TaxID=2545455 RepID=A0A5P2FWC1_9BACT|nr:hypothetical protein [Rhizosphaericola mali]QES87475.1 hypothetical protein E0W69_001950 [Rhizosphaericola mali]